jgi:hypothetical protein
MNELRNLAIHAPEALVKEMQEKLNTLKERPTRSEVAAAELQLRRDPFDISLHEQLLKMERQIGNQSMVVFLQARGGSIKEGQL